jgi:hypothetical protein
MRADINRMFNAAGAARRANAPGVTSPIKAIVWAAALGLAVSACQSNSNAGSSGNFGPGGTTSPGKAPGYDGTGHYDPNNPPANGFKSHCSKLEPAPNGKLILLAAYQAEAPATGQVDAPLGRLGDVYAWGTGGGGGGGGGHPC